MQNDYQIWEAFRKGEEDALLCIYQHHTDFLFSYGKKFTREEALILDCIHDIFYDLIKNRRTVGTTDNIRLYLLKTFRRKLFRAFAKAGQMPVIEHENEQHIPEITFSVEDKIIRDEESAQKIRYVQESMKHLNARQREALYYKFTCGFDYPEICELMSVSYDTARQLVSRAIQRLKKNLND